MNAQRKAAFLKANGYERTKTTNGDTVWWFEGMAIAEHESPAKAAQIAYDHMYDTNDDFVNPFKQAPVAENQPAPVAAPVDLLKAKNDEIDALKAENARMRSCIQAVAASTSHVWALNYANNMLNELEQAPAATPQAEAMTLSEEFVYKIGDSVTVFGDRGTVAELSRSGQFGTSYGIRFDNKRGVHFHDAEDIEPSDED